MGLITVNGQAYRLTSSLNPFQLDMQVHLVEWKWKHITRAPGFHRGYPNDALLPAEVAAQFPMLYPGIVDAFHRHRQRFPFRLHKFAHHMASSQMANLNLFLPISSTRRPTPFWESSNPTSPASRRSPSIRAFGSNFGMTLSIPSPITIISPAPTWIPP